jgi:hypothetical protein
VGKIAGWFKDPYDAAFDAQALRTLADDEKFDATFPHHPLSRARRKLARLISSVHFHDDVLAAPNFGA